jgi:uncharacterized membrane protein
MPPVNLPPPLHEAHALLQHTCEQAVAIIRPNFHMGLDLFLALIPFVIALLIFRKKSSIPGILWWPLLAIMVLFLPNAPYVLTDVIHFVAKVRVTPPLPIWAMSLLLVEYFFYFLIGMECFVIPLMLWGRTLRRHHWGWLTLPLEILMISLSAFGIYLGRIDRLNSWDVVTDPEHLMVQALRDALNPKPEEMTLLFFLAVLVVFYLIKTFNVLIARLLARDIAPLAS